MTPLKDQEEVQLWETIRKELDKIRWKGFHGFSVKHDCPTLGQFWSQGTHGEADEAVVRERLLVLLDPDPNNPTQRNPKHLIAGRKRLDDGVANRIVFGEPTASIAIPRVTVETIPDALKGDPSEILDTFDPSKLGIVKRNAWLADLRNESNDAISGSRRHDGRVGRVHVLLDRLADEIVADARDTNAIDVAADTEHQDSSNESLVLTRAKPGSLDPIPNPSRRLRRVLAVVLPIAIAACVVTVIIAGSRGQGPLGDTPIHKTDCLSQIPASSSGSAAQLEFGDFVRASTHQSFEDPLRAAPGSRVAVRTRLSNPGPVLIDAVCVSADFPDRATSNPSISVTASSPGASAESPDPSDTVTINTYPPQPVCLVLLPGTTELLDGNSGVVESLPDDLLGDGVMVGPIDVPLSSVRFVQFNVKLTPTERGTGCGSNSESEAAKISSIGG